MPLNELPQGPGGMMERSDGGIVSVHKKAVKVFFFAFWRGILR
jgi:hypothetical protein